MAFKKGTKFLNSVFRPSRLVYKAPDKPAEAPPMIMRSHCTNEAGMKKPSQRSYIHLLDRLITDLN